MASNTIEANTKPSSSDTPAIRWVTSSLKSSYANVCNVSSTREEVILNFGVNQAWERGAPELEIELSSRLILSPFAAKRLSLMLTKLVAEYENRHGVMDTDGGQQAAG